MKDGANRALFRGDVFLTEFEFARPKGKYEYRDKYVIVLRTDPASELNVPVILAQGHQADREPYDWEVLVGPEPGRFTFPTYLDCRWVYTLIKPKIGDRWRFRLSASTMHEVDLRLLKGLQMAPPPSETDQPK